MGFRFELKFPEGDDAGTFATQLTNWKPSEEIIGHGTRHFRIVAIEEEADLFWVEPLEEEAPT
jgi:hypothetical protein